MLTALSLAVCHDSVRDFAALQVAAILDRETRGKPLLGWSEPITTNHILAKMRNICPDHEFIKDLSNQTRANMAKDDSLELLLLKRCASRNDWISLEQAIREGMEDVL